MLEIKSCINSKIFCNHCLVLYCIRGGVGVSEALVDIVYYFKGFFCRSPVHNTQLFDEIGEILLSMCGCLMRMWAVSLSFLKVVKLHS